MQLLTVCNINPTSTYTVVNWYQTWSARPQVTSDCPSSTGHWKVTNLLVPTMPKLVLYYRAFPAK